MHPPRLTVGPFVLKLKCTLHRMNMGDNMNIIDDVKAVIFTIWFDKLRGIHREIHRAYNDELFTAKHEIYIWITWQFHESWWPYILEWCFNRRQVHDWLTISMGVGMMHTINQRIILRRSQRENPSWWIKQYHTWGQGQAWWTMQAVIVEDSPGWALHLQLSGWLAHEWANASEEQRKLWDTNKGALWRWSIEGGDLYFKSGKDACISSNLKKKYIFAHIFELLQENP